MFTENGNDKINILYHSGFYDGMLSGVVEYRGERYWADCVYDQWGEYRVFALYELTPEEWENEDTRHQMFVEFVGDHTSYENNMRMARSNRKLKDKSSWNRFSDEAPKNIKNLRDKVPVGYFDKADFKPRKSLSRDYFAHDEQSPRSIHNDCDMDGMIRWIKGSNVFHENPVHERVISDYKSDGWSINIKDEGHVIIEYCPWCNVKLPLKPLQKGEKNDN